MYLFFDTETTGLPKSFKAPVEDLNNWPRMVQLAWQVYNFNGELVENKNYIIKPEGYIIPDEVAKIHRITQERAEREGLDLLEALSDFKKDSDNSEFIVAHNMSFDEKIVAAELLRKEQENFFPFLRKICTMKSTVNFCRISARNKNGYKWPNLTELHQCLFREDFEDAHDALIDVKACARCFFELKKRNVLF